MLKVAVDDAAAARIADEAGVLAGLTDPRLVRLVEGPLDVGGRQALVLESAGEETLGEVLRGRERLSLDLLERWGTDLLEALVALDRAGVDHRDIKPANLGVREGRSDRAKHLVLFDFSLSRAGATAVTAGTPPYLDPFLDAPERGRYDSAAERYSAAVVLFEMATGAAPRFGDGLFRPASVRDEATVEAGMFDPAVAEPLVAFFRTALARNAKERHDTAAEMLAAWRSVFAPVPKTIPDDADERAAAAEPPTPLAEAGPVRPCAVRAGALRRGHRRRPGRGRPGAAEPPVRGGRGDPPRGQGPGQAVAGQVRPRRHRPRTGSPNGAGARLLRRCPIPLRRPSCSWRTPGRPARRRGAPWPACCSGSTPGSTPSPARTSWPRLLGVTRARVAQQVGALQDGWADPRRRAATCSTPSRRPPGSALADMGGVATVDELAGAVLAALPPSADAARTPCRRPGSPRACCAWPWTGRRR